MKDRAATERRRHDPDGPSAGESLLTALTDDDVDALLAGRVDDGQLEPVLHALDQIRDEYSGPQPHPARAAITVSRAARVAATAAASRAATARRGPVVAEPRRRHVVLKRAARSAAIACGIVGISGSLAWADTLPDPAQELVARAAETIGIDLPAPSHDSPPVVSERPASDVDGDSDGGSTSGQPEGGGPSTADPATAGTPPEDGRGSGPGDGRPGTAGPATTDDHQPPPDDPAPPAPDQGPNPAPAPNPVPPSDPGPPPDQGPPSDPGPPPDRAPTTPPKPAEKAKSSAAGAAGTTTTTGPSGRPADTGSESP